MTSLNNKNEFKYMTKIIKARGFKLILLCFFVLVITN